MPDKERHQAIEPEARRLIAFLPLAFPARSALIRRRYDIGFSPLLFRNSRNVELLLPSLDLERSLSPLKVRLEFKW